MTIQFECTGCKTPLCLPDEMGGSRAQCVQCGAIFTIPSPTAHYWPPGSKQAAAAVPHAVAPPARPTPSTMPPLPQHTDAPGDSSISHAPLAMAMATPARAVTPQVPPPVHAAPNGTNGANGSHDANGSHGTTRAGAGAAAARSHAASRPVMILDANDCLEVEEVLARPETIQAGDILKRAWGIYKNSFSSLVAAGLLLVALVGLVNFAVVAGMQLVEAPHVVRLCLAQALLTWLAAGTIDYLLKTARGRRPGVATLLGGMPMFWSVLVTWAICFVPLALLAAGAAALDISPLMVTIGFALSSVVIAFMIWTPAILALVDHEPSPIEALAQAANYARRNLLPLAGLLGVAIGILAASSLPLGLGLPLGVPFVGLVATVAYLRDRANRE